MRKIFFSLLTASISYMLYLKFSGVEKQANHWLLLLGLLFSLALVGYAWYDRHKKRTTTKALPNGFRNIVINQIATGLFISTGLSLFSFLLYLFFGNPSFHLEKLTLTLILYATIFSMGAAVVEEIAFRGLIQGTFHRFIKNPLLAPIVILPGVCAFVYTHKGNLPDLFQSRIALVALWGIIAGIMAYMTHALWLSMGAHFAWNFFQIIAFGHEQRRFEPQAGIMNWSLEFRQCAVFVLGIFLLAWFIFKKYQRNHNTSSVTNANRAIPTLTP